MRRGKEAQVSPAPFTVKPVSPENQYAHEDSVEVVHAQIQHSYRGKNKFKPSSQTPVKG